MKRYKRNSYIRFFFMSIPYFDEVFRYPIDEFTRHLSLENNERIFFSARYGAGKTTFLKDFFQLDEIKKDYEVYHLFPVNYSISANEDIFRYIKFDIIIAMLERGDEFPEQSKSYLQTLPQFMLKRMDKVLAAIIAMIPEVGKSVLDMFERLEKLKDEYLAAHDAANTGPGDQLIEYIEQLEDQAGSIMENDIITRIIAGKVQQNAPKKSVLIMDDLDRLDPEHVFRILNVFAAHFDSRSSTAGANKLGFDKVIIVCDIANIRHIFHHRYGPRVDFAGYIDKFFSKEVYYFDNRAAVTNVARQIANSYHLPDNKEEIKKIYFSGMLIYEVLVLLLERGFISLRAVGTTYGKRLTYHEEEIKMPGVSHAVKAWRLPMVSQLKYLSEILGGADHLIGILEIFIRELVILPEAYIQPGMLLYLLNYDTVVNKGLPAFVYYNDRRFILEVERDFSYNSDLVKSVMLFTTGDQPEIERAKGPAFDMPIDEYWQLMIEVVRRLQTLGYLH
ncbi:hypothetical protein J2T02_002560 [Chitinophaga terrae (ex Kim and Jung 2007)]|uniref:P-loop NTPase fold protein n=1 Tax=Chitinophaga terrae (ex Kim and Jung 2007) TaxID=408074 RepID=UPI00277F1CAB|nr:P-loop NTPase fold protein [Chitinophaga terrae (ex Kim and Jung 2007)]MDQ0107441.1 hypothetical protein [Chitinophaga terrae (ex Kim and Jung 2007)]